MNVRRILAVADCAHNACLEEAVWRRLAPLFSRGATVDALLVRSSRELCSRLAAQGIRVRLAETQGSPGWAAIRNLAAMARAAEATVLYAHGEFAHMLCALTGPLLGVPVIAHLLRGASLVDAHAYALCRSTVIVPTDFVRSQALAVGCGDVVVVATPACFDARRPGRSSAGMVIAGWAGAWHEDDDPQLFLRAAATVARALPHLRFVMSVPASATASGRAEAAKSLAGRALVIPLRFGTHGFTEHVDLYVHTARHDVIHVTLADALAAGLPVVATTAGGSIELLASGAAPAASCCAHLYRPGDEQALVRALGNACCSLDARPAPSACGSGRSTLDDAATFVDAILDQRAARDPRPTPGSATRTVV